MFAFRPVFYSDGIDVIMSIILDIDYLESVMFTKNEMFGIVRVFKK